MKTNLFKPAPNYEELIKTLKLSDIRYIPLAELGVHPLIKEKFLSKKIQTLNDDVEFWYKAGYDYVKLQPKVDFNPARIGLSNNLTYNDDGTVFRKWASENSGVINNEEDFENYIFPNPSDFDYSNFEEAAKILPEGMCIIGQYGDIFTMTWEMMGFENFSISLYENEDLVTELNKKLGELVFNMFNQFIQFDSVKAIWYSDDIAYTNSLMVSKDVLDKFFFPWLKKIGDLAKAYNKPFIYHTDGILYDVFEKILECGVNAIHPIEPKAMKIEEVKEKFGDKLCLIGNIDVDLLSRGTPEEIKKNVLWNLETVGYNGGYCVGSGNSIPEYVNMDNYLMMINTVREHNSNNKYNL